MSETFSVFLRMAVRVISPCTCPSDREEGLISRRGTHPLFTNTCPLPRREMKIKTCESNLLT